MKKFWKRFKATVADNWRSSFVTLLLIALLGGVLVFQLAAIPGGIAESEQQNLELVRSNGLSPEYILRNPVFLPHSIALFILQLTPFDGLATMRAVSVIFGILGAFGFYYILKKWYSPRVAVLGSLLFVTSSWFLHTARFSDVSATYLLIPLLIAAVVAIQSRARAPWMLLLVVAMGFGLLYVPGLFWFIALAVILQRKTIVKSVLLQPIWFRVVLGLIALLMLAPLVVTVVWPLPQTTGLHNGLTLLGLPLGLPNPIEFAKEIVRTLSDIFVYSKAGALYGPGHLPWLDACTSILAVLGAIQFMKHIKLDRTKLLAVVGAVGLLLIAAEGPVKIVFLLPFIYLLVVEGLKWLLDMWLGVFPRNPVARGFGVTFAVILVFAVSAYHLQKYFLAWGQSPETRQVFNREP